MFGISFFNLMNYFKNRELVQKNTQTKQTEIVLQSWPEPSQDVHVINLSRVTLSFPPFPPTIYQETILYWVYTAVRLCTESHSSSQSEKLTIMFWMLQNRTVNTVISYVLFHGYWFYLWHNLYTYGVHAYTATVSACAWHSPATYLVSQSHDSNYCV